MFRFSWKKLFLGNAKCVRSTEVFEKTRLSNPLRRPLQPTSLLNIVRCTGGRIIGKPVTDRIFLKRQYKKFKKHITSAKTNLECYFFLTFPLFKQIIFMSMILHIHHLGQLTIGNIVIIGKYRYQCLGSHISNIGIGIISISYNSIISYAICKGMNVANAM